MAFGFLQLVKAMVVGFLQLVNAVVVGFIQLVNGMVVGCSAASQCHGRTGVSIASQCHVLRIRGFLVRVGCPQPAFVPILL